MAATPTSLARHASPATPAEAVAPSLGRLHALRAAYLLLVVGLGVEVWPGLIGHRGPWEVMDSAVACMLAAVSLLALVGLRHPLRMLPLLLFETLWKAIWLIVVATPLWLGDGMDPHTWNTAAACLMGVVFPLVMPWRYVVQSLVVASGDRWR